MLRRMMKYPYASTRARALSAAFLKADDFAELTRLRDREEAHRTLAGKNFLASVTAEEIEEALRLDFILFGRGIARSLPGADRRLIETYLQRHDFENLKIVCRRLLGGRAVLEEDTPLLPPGPSSPFPSPAHLRQVANLEDLFGLLPREPFRPLLRRVPGLPEQERLFYLETSFDRIFWERVHGRLAALPRFDRQAALEILGWRADLDRFNLVHRRWRAGLTALDQHLDLPPLGTLFPEHQVFKAFASQDPETRLAELFPAPIAGNPLSETGEIALARRLYRKLRDVMRSHPFDISVPLAAVLLKELECRDLLAVMEGLRFARPSEQIRSFLSGGR